MSDSYLVIELNHQPVELCKLLKIANLVGGGGEAKIVISEGYVLLNGEVEYQKRKKIYHEDVIEFNGEVVQLLINETLAAAEHQPEKMIPQGGSVAKNKAATKPKSKNKAVKQPNTDAVIESNVEDYAQEIKPKKRRPISF